MKSAATWVAPMEREVESPLGRLLAALAPLLVLLVTLAVLLGGTYLASLL